MPTNGPEQMNIHPFKASYVDLDMVASPDSFFKSVKVEYSSLKESSFFETADKEAFYLYQIKRGKHKYLGFLACVDIRDYAEGRILKHEHTLVDKEQVMMNLIFQRKAMIKPVLLTYPTFEPMKKWMHEFKNEHKPFFTVRMEEVNEDHCIWQIDDAPTIARFKRAFKEEIGKAYIADGHHRSSTIFKLYQSGQAQKHQLNLDKLFAVFFDYEELEVYDYNRIVEALDEISPSKFMAGISKYCEIETLKDLRKPKEKHEITMCLSGEWYSLKWRKKALSLYKKEKVVLDAQLLGDLIFSKVLNIADVTTDSRISYVEGIKGVEALQLKVHKKPFSIGFCLYPVELSDVVKIAEANKVMPPKTTWFEPRIRNGMLVYEMQ